MKAKRYRKKPAEIEAMRVEDGAVSTVTKWCGGRVLKDGSRHVGILIDTLEGTMRAELGDYAIKGVQGEFYPCKPDIFEQTYEEIEE